MYIYYGSKHSMENKRFNSAVTAYDWLNGKQKILHRKKKDERTRIKECSEMCFISTEQRDRVMQKKKRTGSTNGPLLNDSALMRSASMPQMCHKQ